MQFIDINADGINEVVWTKNSTEHADITEMINCWSVTGDSLVWRRPLIFDLRFPRKSGIRDNAFIMQTLLKERFPDGSTYIIGSSTMRGTFPGLLFLLNPATGKIKSRYVHTGQIGDMELIDLQGDSLRELVFSGVNNAFEKAVLGALDLRNFSGHSPLRGDYVVGGMAAAEELHYLLIPKTKVGKYLNPINRYNVTHEINFSRQDSMISVWVDDGSAKPFENIERDLRILAYFNYNFRPLGFTTSDQYDIVSENMAEAGKISAEPNYDYFEAFKDSILYWRGDEFVRYGQIK